VKEFIKTSAGRLLVFGLGLVLAGGGVASLAAQPMATFVMAAVFPVAIALCVVALATAATDSWGYAVAGVIALPFLALLYVPALSVAAERGSWVGWPLILIGTGALAFGIRPKARTEPAFRPMPATHH